MVVGCIIQKRNHNYFSSGISTFADGHGPNNDPLKGYFLIFFISLICVMIGDLDAVSALLSNFFVASYALMNFAVFHVSVTHNPGWRPSFKVLKLLMYIEST